MEKCKTSFAERGIKTCSAGVLQANSEERARVLHQQRQLSLRRRARANSQTAAIFSKNPINDDLRRAITPAIRRHYSVPREEREEEEKRSLEERHDTRLGVKRRTIPIIEINKDFPEFTSKLLNTTEKENTVPDRIVNEEIFTPFDQTLEKHETIAYTEPMASNDKPISIDNSWSTRENTEQDINIPSSTTESKATDGFQEFQGIKSIHVDDTSRKTFSTKCNSGSNLDASIKSKSNQYIDTLNDKNEKENEKSLLTAAVQQSTKCYIRRIRRGIFSGCCYHLYFKDEDKAIMTSYKRSQKQTSNYLIRMVTSHSNEQLDEDEGEIIGKLRSNFLGTEFTIYDEGVNPKYIEQDVYSSYTDNARSELGAILYAPNIMGSKGPRKMAVSVGKIDEETDRPLKKWQPAHSDEEMTTCLKHTNSPLFDQLFVMENKPPKWNEDLSAYVLNFNGRVTMASVKNFQLIDTKDESERIILQFGRISKDEFTMDVDWPLSLLQAFAICLSSFDSKIACD